MSYLQRAVKSVLIPEQLVMVRDTVKPPSIYQCLADRYSLGPAVDKQTDRESEGGKRDMERERKEV